MNIRANIKLHIAMMIKELLRDYEDRPLSSLDLYDVMQLSHDFKAVLQHVATHLGDDEGDLDDVTSEWARAQIKRSRDFAVDEYPFMRRLSEDNARDRALLAADAEDAEDAEDAADYDFMAITREMSR